VVLPFMQDTSCNGWINCIKGCATAACFDGCDAQHAGAAAMYKPIYGCICSNCNPQCGPATGACSKM